jgi:hypothetical protein
MRETPSQTPRPGEALDTGRVLALILAGSVLVKLLLIAYLDGRVYGDVLRSVNFGLGLEEGLISISTHVDNTRSFLGPMLAAAAYHAGGVAAIKLCNLLLFAGLFATMVRLGSGRHEVRVVVVAVAFFAFYAGGHRNVAAGELEDNLASLLFAVALLAHVSSGRRIFAPALLMGVAFLVKFWVAVFVGGFGLFLLVERRFRDAALAGLAAALPFLLVAIPDGGATLRALLMTVERQSGYSSWHLIGFRMLSTGLLPTVVLSLWSVRQRPSARGRLYLFLVASFFAYVVAFRDAHAVSFVMMLALVPAGFLVAELLVRHRAVGGAEGSGRWRLAALLAAYVVANAAIAWHNLRRDTHPFAVDPGAGAKPLATSSTPSVGSSR